MSSLMYDRWNASNDNFPEENTVTLPISTVEKDESIKVYCEECTTPGSQKGTLIVSGYDNYCDGCGRSFKDIAEGITE